MTMAAPDPSIASKAASMPVKRALDLGLAGVLAILLAPLMLGVALAIKLADGGPVLYGQTRVGLSGRRFNLWKFRTMVPDADRLGGYQTVKGDARITPVGRWLRRASIDELPQLVNVLIGDMSLVGPRPDTPAQIGQYTPADAALRVSVRPGLTGPAQIYHKRVVSDRSRLDWDIDYIRTRSTGGDLRLLVRTLTTVLRLQNR